MSSEFRAARAAFLGIERSLTGRRWAARLADERMALAMAQRHGLPDAICRLLAAREVDLEGVPDFLEPTLRKFLPDPSHLKDMDAAVARVVRAVREGEKIVIFGDYDVDGATSSALLARFFRAVGGNVAVYIPDRRKEGYGPNTPALLGIKEQGAAVVITVDCGITAFEPLAEARRVGLDLIVIDHHMAEIALPQAVAVVDPNRLDDDSPHKQMAAVGVTFLLAVGVNRALREAGWYGVGRSEPDLRQWLDLVALGTVCDVVPLTGVNRALVAQGIRVARQMRNPGMRALAAVGGVSAPIDAYHLGFVLGPRVNAGGRVGAADLGARLLATDDPILAAELAQQLDGYNRERREIEAQTLAAAIEHVEARPQSPALVFAAEEGWHPGVIGIVAARLKERYERPACVVAITDGIGKGSGRSLPGLALGPAVIAARQAGLLINGGGHAMAAGFTVAAERIEALREFLAERLGDGIGLARPVPELAIDGALSAAGATGGLIGHVEALAPYGAANPEPRFAFPGLRVAHVEPVGHGHLRGTLADVCGPARLKAIAFRAAETPLGQFLAGARGRAIHIAGHLRRDDWRGGDSVQLIVDDAAPAE